MAVVRSASKYETQSSSSAITVISTPFDDNLSLANAFQGQDAVLCCVPGGATRFDAQKILIDAAIAAGVKLYFASEYSSNIMSPHYQIFPTEFVGDKVKVRRYLEKKAAEGQMSWTALNGGPFFDMCEPCLRPFFPGLLRFQGSGKASRASTFSRTVPSSTVRATIFHVGHLPEL